MNGERDDSLVAEIESPQGEAERTEAPARGWSRPSGPPTTLVLVRHGVTAHTVEKRFSGGLASADPPLSDQGREQVRDSATWIAPLAGQVAAVVASPVRRTRESAEIVAEVLGLPVSEVVDEPGFAEMEFGVWDGLTFAEVGARFPGALEAWLGSLDAAPEGGESFQVVRDRVLAGLDRVVARYRGRTVVVTSHVTPIKTLVAHALGAGLAAVFKMELAPASVTVLRFYGAAEDGADHAEGGSLRLYNGLPPQRDPFASGAW